MSICENFPFIPLVFYWVVFSLLGSFKQKKYPTNVHLWGQSVRPSVCPLKSKSFDNSKTIEARRMKLGMYIGSNVYNMHAQHLGHYLEAKLCRVHNFVIWSQILKLLHRNDRHIETTCHAQHLGRYLKGQGHSMTLKQNHVRPITLLFEVGF